MDASILIVDDEKHTREGLRLSLEDDFEVYIAANIGEAMETLRNDSIDLMVTDLRLGSENGMQLIEDALQLPRAPICIMMTAYGSVDTAVEAMKKGAYHFVTKPLHIDELEIVIKRALHGRRMESENHSLKRQVEGKFYDLQNIIGRSAAMESVLEVVRQVAPTRATILVDGENGTGKELICQAIHQLSGRPKSKLVIVHCAALSDQLLESELLGHEKGAFTGATERRIGRFEAASGGTLMLDEIGEIDGSTQVKLLRALGERTIERVGGNQPIKVDVRLVTATNKDLEQLISEGKFREDLFYRLNVVRITIPPLRERRDDIIPLTNHFLKAAAEENGKPFREMTPEAMECLLDCSWPGNVRQLRTVVEHSVVMANGTKITPRNLPANVRESHKNKNGSKPEGGKIALESVEDFNLHAMERRLITQALKNTGENRTEAAKLLGISRRTLQRKLKEKE